MRSPRRKPACCNSMVAVTGFVVADDWSLLILLSPLRVADGLDSTTDPVPQLLWPLSKLISLGEGLCGGSASMEFVLVMFLSKTVCKEAASFFCWIPLMGAFLHLFLCLLFPRREIGSREMTRGLGWYNVAISMFSWYPILQSQVIVGDIVVGRVRVALIIYEIVPRSNCH